MWQYSVDEQTEIVNFGKQKIKEWIGIDALAHRAGGYGADDNTMQALKFNDIFIDSSFFYKNENCKINYDYISHPKKMAFYSYQLAFMKSKNAMVLQKQKVAFKNLILDTVLAWMKF